MITLRKEKIRNSGFAQALSRFANSNIIAKSIVGIIIWLGALIPTWLYLIARWLIEPSTFWQEFAIFAIFAIGIGWLQAILAFFGFIVTLVVIVEDL